MWQIILAIGFAFLILEMFVPSMFFLNFAVAAFICAVLSLISNSIPLLIVVFCVLSVILIFSLRPVLMKNLKGKHLETGMEAKYVGKIARAIEDIDKTKGTVTIYDERWQARCADDTVIPAGANVEIVSYDSIVFCVKKCD